MGPCYTCKKTVAFGGVKDRGFRFCSKACHVQKAALIDAISAVPAATVDAEALRIRNGQCSKCRKSGNVDFHKSAFVWSAILVTRMSERTFIGCPGCAREAQALSFAGTMVAGWWGIPFGILMTPAALAANVYQMIRSGMHDRPSDRLKDYARERLAFTSSHRDFDSSDVRSDGRIEPIF